MKLDPIALITCLATFVVAAAFMLSQSAAPSQAGQPQPAAPATELAAAPAE